MRAAEAVVSWGLFLAVSAIPAESARIHQVVTHPFVLPGGIADPAGRTGFIANARNGVTAIDLRGGTVLWESTVARLPLLVTGERLYASRQIGADSMRVVALDITRKGVMVFESELLVAPQSAHGRTVTARWWLSGDQLRLSWEIAGASVPLETLEVDLRDGSVHSVTLPDNNLAAKLPKELTKQVVRWQGTIGETFKALVLEENGHGQKMILYSWDRVTEARQPARELLEGKRLVVRTSVNNEVLCLRDATPNPDQQINERGQQLWSIFSVETGDRIAQLPFDASTQAIAVFGTRAFCLVAGRVRAPLDRSFVHPRILKAIDIPTGKVLWEQPVAGKELLPPGN